MASVSLIIIILLWFPTWCLCAYTRLRNLDGGFRALELNFNWRNDKIILLDVYNVCLKTNQRNLLDALLILQSWKRNSFGVHMKILRFQCIWCIKWGVKILVLWLFQFLAVKEIFKMVLNTYFILYWTKLGLLFYIRPWIS